MNRTSDGALSSEMWPGESGQPIARLVEDLLNRFQPDSRLYLSGSPHVPLPWHVGRAVAESVALQGTAPSPGEPALRAALAASLAVRGLRVTPGQVLVTDGAMHALDLVFRALLEPGDEVLMPAPGFFINGLVERSGGRLVRFPSPAADGFRPSWAAAEEFVTARTRILYVNTPVNPTGYVYDEDDVMSAAELADRHGLILVSDESLANFVYGGRPHRSPAATAAEGNAAASILVGSFSKDYAMPGMRVGYAVLAGESLDRVSALLEWSVLAVSRPAQAAALAALTGPRDWVDQMTADAAARGARLAAALAAIPGLRCVPARGGLNLFPRFAGDAERLAYELVVRFGVPACPGSSFGYPGYFRLQFGSGGDEISAAVTRIGDAVAITTAGTQGHRA